MAIATFLEKHPKARMETRRNTAGKLPFANFRIWGGMSCKLLLDLWLQSHVDWRPLLTNFKEISESPLADSSQKLKTLTLHLDDQVTKVVFLGIGNAV